MFPYVDRSYRRVILESVETVRHLVASTFTAGGLEVVAPILRNAYQSELKVATKTLGSIRRLPAKIFPAWIYRIESQPVWDVGKLLNLRSLSPKVGCPLLKKI